MDAPPILPLLFLSLIVHFFVFSTNPKINTISLSFSLIFC